MVMTTLYRGSVGGGVPVGPPARGPREAGRAAGGGRPRGSARPRRPRRRQPRRPDPPRRAGCPSGPAPGGGGGCRPAGRGRAFPPRSARRPGRRRSRGSAARPPRRGRSPPTRPDAGAAGSARARSRPSWPEARRPPAWRPSRPAPGALEARARGGLAAASALLEDAGAGDRGSADEPGVRGIPGHLPGREDTLDLEVEVVRVGGGVARSFVRHQLLAIEAEEGLVEGLHAVLGLPGRNDRGDLRRLAL